MSSTGKLTQMLLITCLDYRPARESNKVNF